MTRFLLLYLHRVFKLKTQWSILILGFSEIIPEFYFQTSFHDGIWTLEIKKVGHDDAGNYECQTNTEVKTSVTVQLNIMGKSEVNV